MELNDYHINNLYPGHGPNYSKQEVQKIINQVVRIQQRKSTDKIKELEDAIDQITTHSRTIVNLIDSVKGDMDIGEASKMNLESLMAMPPLYETPCGVRYNAHSNMIRHVTGLSAGQKLKDRSSCKKCKKLMDAANSRKPAETILETLIEPVEGDAADSETETVGHDELIDPSTDEFSQPQAGSSNVHSQDGNFGELSEDEEAIDTLKPTVRPRKALSRVPLSAKAKQARKQKTEYKVEKILDRRFDGEVVEYFVKWESSAISSIHESRDAIVTE